jgi:hypothetical protein
MDKEKVSEDLVLIVIWNLQIDSYLKIITSALVCVCLCSSLLLQQSLYLGHQFLSLLSTKVASSNPDQAWRTRYNNEHIMW